MKKLSPLWQKALKDTLPVMMGYLAMGTAAGILLSGTLKQLPLQVLWAGVSSTLSISGALQFIMVGWIRDSVPLTDVILLTIFLNLRYAMYGLSLIERFDGIPRWQKFYLIWSLTDETYALQCSASGNDKKALISYSLKVAMLDHFYWVAGVTLGSVLGVGLPFNSKGIDFAMTALFLVILTDQCRRSVNRFPALIGLGSAITARCFFTTSRMLIPAMILMTVIFLLLRPRLEKEMSE